LGNGPTCPPLEPALVAIKDRRTVTVTVLGPQFWGYRLPKKKPRGIQGKKKKKKKKSKPVPVGTRLPERNPRGIQTNILQ
jgi:hypothetical protein